MANAHWHELGSGRDVPLVFSTGHGYVSPSTYGFEPAVPTLDYAAVHLTGAVEVITDPDATLHVVEQTVAALEALRDPAWDPTRSRARFVELVPHVVAFRFTVTAARSLFKLSQDMPTTVRARIEADLRPAHPALADLIAETPR